MIEISKFKTVSVEWLKEMLNNKSPKSKSLGEVVSTGYGTGRSVTEWELDDRKSEVFKDIKEKVQKAIEAAKSEGDLSLTILHGLPARGSLNDR